VSVGHGGLPKQGAHVLDVECRERPTRVVGRKLGVTNGSHTLTPHRVVLILNGEQGYGGVVEARQVVLTKLHEGLVGSSL
jgi:IMP cyclohydrolase